MNDKKAYTPIFFKRKRKITNPTVRRKNKLRYLKNKSKIKRYNKIWRKKNKSVLKTRQKLKKLIRRR